MRGEIRLLHAPGVGQHDATQTQLSLEGMGMGTKGDAGSWGMVGGLLAVTWLLLA